MHEDPVAACEVNSFADGALSHDVFIASYQLVLLEHLGSFKNSGIHSCTLRLNYKAPIFQRFLVAELCDHFSNAPALLSWVNSSLGQAVTHTNRFLDASGHAINQTELGGKVGFSV